MTSPVRDRAMVIGASGQDGSYMSELLLDRGYNVLGVVRRDPATEFPNLAGVRERIELTQAELTDSDALAAAVAAFRPQEVYNFASVSFGPDAWTEPSRTTELGTLAVAKLIETLLDHDDPVRFFQASSSWVFGRPAESPQNEDTCFRPAEPYGSAKAFGNFLIRNFRDHSGFFGCSGIFFNHESPRRPEQFVTRKITRTAARIKLGLADELTLGDIEARRDWSFAGDFVEAVWLMLQQDTPDDYVLASGQLHSVREFVAAAFVRLDLDWERYVRYDESLKRGQAQVTDLLGDATRAQDRLGWQPRVAFEDLVAMMVDADLAELQAAG
ncbi:MAG: GDP-mannose 4,6-dehydratase [Solirubrobacterales bacterium]